jgi:hypothetical protein
MFWVAFQGYYGGKAISLGTIEQGEAELYGFHGYPTAAEAQAKPNIVPAIAKAQVNAWVFNAQGSVTSHAAAKAKSVASSALGSGWNLVFGNTTGLGTRILKVVFGGALLVIGFLRMTGADKAIGTVGKAAAIA